MISEKQAHGSVLAEQPGPGHLSRSLSPAAFVLSLNRRKLWRLFFKLVVACQVLLCLLCLSWFPPFSLLSRHTLALYSAILQGDALGECVSRMPFPILSLSSHTAWRSPQGHLKSHTSVLPSEAHRLFHFCIIVPLCVFTPTDGTLGQIMPCYYSTFVFPVYS